MSSSSGNFTNCSSFSTTSYLRLFSLKEKRWRWRIMILGIITKEIDFYAFELLRSHFSQWYWMGTGLRMSWMELWRESLQWRVRVMKGLKVTLWQPLGQVIRVFSMPVKMSSIIEGCEALYSSRTCSWDFPPTLPSKLWPSTGVPSSCKFWTRYNRNSWASC